MVRDFGEDWRNNFPFSNDPPLERFIFVNWGNLMLSVGLPVLGECVLMEDTKRNWIRVKFLLMTDPPYNYEFVVLEINQLELLV
jgi:hypothetical protein